MIEARPRPSMTGEGLPKGVSQNSTNNRSRCNFTWASTGCEEKTKEGGRQERRSMKRGGGRQGFQTLPASPQFSYLGTSQPLVRFHLSLSGTRCRTSSQSFHAAHPWAMKFGHSNRRSYDLRKCCSCVETRHSSKPSQAMPRCIERPVEDAVCTNMNTAAARAW